MEEGFFYPISLPLEGEDVVGFKLHLVFNHINEIVAVTLTPGNVSDATPVPA